MSYLKTVSLNDATGDVAEVYQEVTANFGGVPGIMQVHSTVPFHLRQKWEFIKHSLRNPNLSGALQATVRMTVSQGTIRRLGTGFMDGGG